MAAERYLSRRIPDSRVGNDIDKIDKKPIQAYKIEVFQSGKFHSLEKRYSEFEELHKQLKKVISTPEFPPKKVLKWQSKVLETRRVMLESYLQGILEGETIPRSFFKFLEVTLPRSGSFDSLDRGIPEPSSTHQPMVGFCKDAYLQENYRIAVLQRFYGSGKISVRNLLARKMIIKGILPDIVVVGVHEGLYIDQNDDYIFR